MSTAEDPNAWMADKIFKTLSGMGHKVYMYNAEGERVFDPATTNRMWSDTSKMMVTLDYTKGKPAMPLVTFNPSESTDMKVLQTVKDTLKQHNLYNHSFDTWQFGQHELEPKMFAHMNKQDVSESAWTGSTRTSRWKTGVTEVVIRHSERLMDDQSARRWCKVRDIFIHGPDGGRYRMPIKHIAGAKALAQHIDQNGQAWDTQGETIMHMIQVLQQCRRLRNWMQQDHAHLVPELDVMQNKIKMCLKHVSDQHHYADAIQNVSEMVNMWREQAELHEAPCGEQIQEAWHALMCETATHAEPDHMHMEDQIPPHEDPWPEHRELMEWFNQFDVLTELKDEDVKSAVDITKSKKPRELLAHLSNEIPGWKRTFKDDPKRVLDQITDTLEKLKKVG